MSIQRKENDRVRQRVRRAGCGKAGLVFLAVCLLPAAFTVFGEEKREEKPFDLFPTGTPWLDVRIPRYDDKDQLTSMMHTEALTRQNEKELKLDGLTLVMFQSSGEISLRLKTKEGLYDAGASMLRTHSTTFIEHAQFKMQGDRMTFDTAKQQGTLRGNVEMLIYGLPVQTPVPVAPSAPAAAPASPAPARPAPPAVEGKPRPESQQNAEQPIPVVEVVHVHSSVRSLSSKP
jgi:hypothetical protein